MQKSRLRLKSDEISTIHAKPTGRRMVPGRSIIGIALSEHRQRPLTYIAHRTSCDGTARETIPPPARFTTTSGHDFELGAMPVG